MKKILSATLVALTIATTVVPANAAAIKDVKGMYQNSHEIPYEYKPFDKKLAKAMYDELKALPNRDKSTIINYMNKVNDNYPRFTVPQSGLNRAKAYANGFKRYIDIYTTNQPTQQSKIEDIYTLTDARQVDQNLSNEEKVKTIRSYGLKKYDDYKYLKGAPYENLGHLELIAGMYNELSIPAATLESNMMRADVNKIIDKYEKLGLDMKTLHQDTVFRADTYEIPELYPSDWTPELTSEDILASIKRNPLTLRVFQDPSKAVSTVQPLTSVIAPSFNYKGVDYYVLNDGRSYINSKDNTIKVLNYSITKPVSEDDMINNTKMAFGMKRELSLDFLMLELGIDPGLAISKYGKIRYDLLLEAANR